MKQTILIFAAVFALAGCASRPLPPPVVAPIALPPSLCAPLDPEPVLPDGAYPPDPRTPEEAEALTKYNIHAAKVGTHSREGWARAGVALGLCEARPQ